MTGIAPASHEEHEFAAKVNLALKEAASVSPFCRLEGDPPVTTYGLVFSCGSKRHTITSDVPFHIDPVEDVVERVQAWLAKGGAGQLYSPDPRYAGDFDG